MTDSDGLQSLFAQAKTERDGSVAVRELAPIERLAALQRHYAVIHGEQPGPIPESEEALFAACFQPGLGEQEVQSLLGARLADAQITWLRTFNTTWSMSELREKEARMGLAHTLETYEQRVRDELRVALRFLAP